MQYESIHSIHICIKYISDEMDRYPRNTSDRWTECQSEDYENQFGKLTDESEVATINPGHTRHWMTVPDCTQVPRPETYRRVNRHVVA